MTTTFNANNIGIVQTVDLSANLAFQTANANALIITSDQTANFASTGSVLIPSGTTAQRPSSPVNGMMRYNTSFSLLEGYANGAWTAFTGTYNYSISYLIAAGGAGGGTQGGGGGGAGGFLTGTITASPSTVYTATVGGGGSSSAYPYGQGGAGVN